MGDVEGTKSTSLVFIFDPKELSLYSFMNVEIFLIFEVKTVISNNSY